MSIDWEALLDDERRRDGAAWQDDYDHLGRQLARRGDRHRRHPGPRRRRSPSAVPSWGVGTGGTRFARFPGPGEPRNIFEKLDDCARHPPARGASRRRSRCTSRGTSPTTRRRCGAYAGERGLAFDADELQHLRGPARPDALVQVRQPVAHRRGRARAGRRAQPRLHRDRPRRSARGLTRCGSATAATSPASCTSAARSTATSTACGRSTPALPPDWRLFIEHKLYEPAFYSTVINDWGISYYCARELGERAFSLVDLGHHAPNVNIEMIVARLIQFGKLGGFHFNDSKYGDDDLDAGSIKPFQLFLVFNELVDAGARGRGRLRPGLHARPVAQRHRSDRVPDGQRDRGAARLRAGVPRRPGGARGAPGAQRRAHGPRAR